MTEATTPAAEAPERLQARLALQTSARGRAYGDWQAAREVPRATEESVEREKRRRVVVITGASAGVGRAAAEAFGREGASVALLARGAAGLAGARQQVERAGGRGLGLEVDVAAADEVESAAAIVETELGPIDVWVNNAMQSVFSPVEQMRPEEFRRITEVTYLGAVHGTLAALRRMRPRDRGVIIQVGSALAYRSIPLQSAYCGAKHALVGFTDSLRSELIHQHSRVALCAVHLPALNTPQFGWVRSRLPRKPQPVPPIYQPEVAADAIVWAASHPRRELFVGMPTYKAILGQRVAPGFLDRLLARQAWDGQQYDGRAAPDRPDNLARPLDAQRDWGAHGEFDDRARQASPLLELSKRSRLLGAALAASALLAVGFAVAGATARSQSPGQAGSPPSSLPASRAGSGLLKK
jgi:NAD(P)-dependent dehydrogenase (short-subunit alcohol dehydrogenase family)